jgi:D-isomer specific 2-hydroxyacid dehydrogenase, NAD binding domain
MTAATRGMIGESQLALMKKDAVIINTARGGVVDEAGTLHTARTVTLLSTVRLSVIRLVAAVLIVLYALYYM